MTVTIYLFLKVGIIYGNGWFSDFNQIRFYFIYKACILFYILDVFGIKVLGIIKAIKIQDILFAIIENYKHNKYKYITLSITHYCF